MLCNVLNKKIWLWWPLVFHAVYYDIIQHDLLFYWQQTAAQTIQCTHTSSAVQFSSMQIASSHDPIWIVVGAVLHSKNCSTGLTRLPSAIQRKKKGYLENLQAQKRNESNKQHNKGRIVIWYRLYLASKSRKRRDSPTNSSFY